jgi:hypothetical protein
MARLLDRSLELPDPAIGGPVWRSSVRTIQRAAPSGIDVDAALLQALTILLDDPTPSVAGVEVELVGAGWSLGIRRPSGKRASTTSDGASRNAEGGTRCRDRARRSPPATLSPTRLLPATPWRPSDW